MREFTWNCGASVLVDDAYSKWDIKAETVEEAYIKAMEHIRSVNGKQKGNIIDEGTLDISMDITELAREMGNLASGNDDDWTPVQLTREIEECSHCRELIGTLEWIVCNANKEGKL